MQHLHARRSVLAVPALILIAGLIGFVCYRPGRVVNASAPSRGHAANESSRADSPASGGSVGQAERERLESAYGQLPLSFEQNAGQFGRGVNFAARGDGYSISLKPTEMVLDLRETSATAEDSERPHGAVSSARRRASDRIRVRVADANPAVRVAGVERLPGVSNYFIGRDPAAWRAGVPTFAKVSYASVYPGVDLVYYGNQRQLEYDFLVAPGADPRRIALEFGGTEGVRLDANGDLVLRAEGGRELRQLKPVSYQLIGGERREVESRYALSDNGRAVFELGEYDPNHSLVIDPVISYATYLGGALADRGHGIAADAAGTAYVVGRTSSANFPVVSALKATKSANADAFVVRIGQSVDLAVSVADAPDPVAFGGNLTYTVDVSNAGELPATGVRLTHTLPAGAGLVSADSTQGACSGAGPVVCELGSLAGGASATVTVVVAAPAVRTLNATATVAANEAESITANNTDSETTLVDFADLSASASALRDPVPAGGRLTYLFGVSNLAGADASNVILNVALPAGVTFVSCSSEGGVCGGSGSARTVTFASLAAGAARSALVTVEVNAGAAEGTTLTASASVSSALPDPATANNSASAGATVAANVVAPKANGKLAFNVFNDGLYVINEDGTGQTKIFNGERVTLPSWSPDGTRVAFVNEVSTSSFVTFEVWVVNADGTNAHLLSTNGGLDSRPTWSPNSAVVAFAVRNRTAIQAVNAAGDPAPATLVSDLSFLGDAVWSPDGTKFLYDASGNIWTVNVDGTGRTPLVSDPNFFDTHPVWSPDGSKIMFERQQQGASGQIIYEVNADGSNVRTLPNSRNGNRPVYSPDGQKIAFGALFTMLADGTNLQQIPSKADSFSTVSWQPLPGGTPPPPPPPSYRIAGRVSFPASHSQLAFFTIHLTGTRTASTGTDAEGNYSFTVPAGSYTVTPEPDPFLSVSPESRAVNVVNADQTGVDFTATPIIYSISGRVRAADGTPLPGIEVTLSGGNPPQRTTVTGADGSYSFVNLSHFFSYSVFVSLSSRTIYDFEPDARAFAPLGQSRVVDFVGTPKRRFEIGASHTVNEGDGRVSVTVTRAGDASAAASVDYSTADSDTFTVGCADAAGAQGKAYARCDFATTVGTLQFAPGETTKTLTVPVIDDGHAEGPETFQLQLSNPTGAGLGTQTTATVTVTDNDAAGAANPVTGPPHEFFVRQQYLDFLSREPDQNGFNAWLGVLNNCQPNASTGPEVQSGCDRIFVSGEGFFRSVEFQLKGAYAFRFYKLGFNRLPEYLEIVSDMSFVAGATQAEVFARRAQLATLFTQRQEFKGTYDGMTNQQYVNALLGRYNLQQVTTPDPSNPDAGAKVTLTGAELANRLDTGTLTRAQVLRAVADSDEVTAREFDNAFVAMQYYGYLRRKPEPSGYEAWLRVLQSGDTRTMVNGFLNSDEYKLRFGRQ